jgi:CysZ protein
MPGMTAYYRRDEPPAGRGGPGAGRGVGAVLGGAGFVLGTPSVWGYALVPVAMLLVLACGLGGLGVWGAGRLIDVLLGTELSWWGQMGGWILTVLLALVALFVALLLALLLAQPFSGFALEAIALAQERALTGRVGQPLPFLDALLASMKIALVTVGVGGTALAGLFVVSLLVPPAAVVTVPLKFLVGAWLLAWNFLDYPLGLRGLGVTARLRWAGRHFGAFTAFGLGWAVLLVVPGTFLLALPMGVAGATQLVVAGEQGPPPCVRPL